MLRQITNRLMRQSWSISSQRQLSTVETSKVFREPGVVGLSEDTNSRQTLSELYEKTLEAVKEIPEDAAYRVNVEKVIKYRMKVVKGTEDTELIEGTLDIGQMPEIIEQAQDELELIPFMMQWKPWEPTSNNKPVVIEVVE